MTAPPTSTPTAPQIEVYPNPSSTLLHLRYQVLQSGNYQAQLSDAHGKTVLEHNLGRRAARFHTSEIDVSHLPAGIYVLKIGNGNSFTCKKISIIH